MNQELIDRLVKRTADLAIGASTVRNQGAVGVVSAARKTLRLIDLASYRSGGVSRFGDLLNRDTERIRRALPTGARHWGTARKCVNIFLRDILYNYLLSDQFGFSKLEPFLEVPLDRHVAKGLFKDKGSNQLPRWRTIKSLTPELSTEFQSAAASVAKRKQTHPVHLDLIYWRANQLKT
jgi:hypothetical protein